MTTIGKQHPDILDKAAFEVILQGCFFQIHDIALIIPEGNIAPGPDLAAGAVKDNPVCLQHCIILIEGDIAGGNNQVFFIVIFYFIGGKTHGFLTIGGFQQGQLTRTGQVFQWWC